MEIRCPECGNLQALADEAEARSRCESCGHEWTRSADPAAADVEEARADEGSRTAPVRSRSQIRRSRRAVRSFRVGAVFGKAVSVWFANFIPFTILAFLVYFPAIVIDWCIAYGVIENDPEALTPVDVGRTLLDIVLAQLLSAALIFGVFQKLRRHPVTIGDSLRRGFACLGPVLVVALAVLVALFGAGGPGIILLIAGANASSSGAALAVLLGFLVFLVPVAYVALGLIVAVPVAVVEKQGVGDALRRSWELTRRKRGRILLAYLLLWLLIWAISIPLGLILGALGVLGSAFEELVLLLVRVPFGALMAALIAVMYHDLRVVKEGIDSEELAAIFD